MRNKEERYFPTIICLFLSIFLMSSSFPLYVMTVLGESTSSMSQFQILFLSYAFQTIFELPSGYLADIFSRKKILILGCLINLFASVYFLNANLPPVYILCWFVLASCCFTGTASAYLYEICLNYRVLHRYLAYESILQAIHFIVWTLSFLYANWLSNWDIHLLYYSVQTSYSDGLLFIVPNVLCILLLLYLPSYVPMRMNPRFRNRYSVNFIDHISATFHQILSNRALVFALIGSAITVGISHCLMNLMYLKSFSENIMTYLLFSSTYIIGCLSSILIYHYHELFNIVRVTRWLCISNILILTLSLLLIIVSQFGLLPYQDVSSMDVFQILFTVGTFILGFMYASLLAPVIEIINAEIAAVYRATAISTSFLIKRITYLLLILISTSTMVNQVEMLLLLLAISWLFIIWFLRQSRKLRQDYPS